MTTVEIASMTEAEAKQTDRIANLRNRLHDNVVMPVMKAAYEGGPA